jgi:hypothetical protein
MTTGIFAALIVLPWCAAGLLLWRNDDRFQHRRATVVLVTALVMVGCLGLAMTDATPQIAFGATSDSTETATMGSRWSWSADRFSLAMVAALMSIIAAASALLPDESPSVWLLTLLIAALVPMWWWSQSVWGLAGISVITSFLMLILPAMTALAGTLGAAQTLWLSTALGDVALVIAIVAGCAGLGDGAAAHYGDPTAMSEFATMRPATAMFVAFWGWLGVLPRAGQLPFSVNFDSMRPYPSRAWMLSVGLGVFALGHRWCDLHRGWWSASPPMTNLILSAALASALLCAWFALCTADLRVRVAYLVAAMFSLTLGPLTSGDDIERVWAAATIIGSLSLAIWLWCVTITPRRPATTEPENAPAWIRILTSGEMQGAPRSVATNPRTVAPICPSILPTSPRGIACLVVVLWCGLCIGVGSWWWEDEPIASATMVTSAVEGADTELAMAAEPVRTRPNGRRPVSTAAVMLIAVAMSAGVRSAFPPSAREESASSPFVPGVILCCAPVGLIVTLAHSEPVLLAIGRRCSPALACLVFAAMVFGGLFAGWPQEHRDKLNAALTIVRRMGEQRLFAPELLRFAANFPLRGLAQLFRFLDWSVVENGSWANLRRLPESLRRFHDEVRLAGNGSDALVLLVSGVALLTTIVWLAHTAH